MGTGLLSGTTTSPGSISRLSSLSGAPRGIVPDTAWRLPCAGMPGQRLHGPARQRRSRPEEPPNELTKNHCEADLDGCGQVTPPQWGERFPRTICERLAGSRRAKAYRGTARRALRSALPRPNARGGGDLDPRRFPLLPLAKTLGAHHSGGTELAGPAVRLPRHGFRQTRFLPRTSRPAAVHAGLLTSWSRERGWVRREVPRRRALLNG
jgi:hypothetical protein